MPRGVYKRTDIHKKRIKEKATGRRFSEDVLKKLRKPKGEVHIARMVESAKRRWSLYREKNKKVGWLVDEPKMKSEPVAPVVNRYVDIFMDDVNRDGWEGIVDKL